MLGLWIDRQEPEVLRRIEAVPEGKLVMGGAVRGHAGEGCLLVHAFGYVECDYRDYDDELVALRFDALCLRRGNARIGRLCSARARRRLEELERAGGDNCEWTGHPRSHRLPASVTAHVRDTRDAREGATV